MAIRVCSQNGSGKTQNSPSLGLSPATPVPSPGPRRLLGSRLRVAQLPPPSPSSWPLWHLRVAPLSTPAQESRNRRARLARGGPSRQCLHPGSPRGQRRGLLLPHWLLGHVSLVHEDGCSLARDPLGPEALVSVLGKPMADPGECLLEPTAPPLSVPCPGQRATWGTPPQMHGRPTALVAVRMPALPRTPVPAGPGGLPPAEGPRPALDTAPALCSLECQWLLRAAWS